MKYAYENKDLIFLLNIDINNKNSYCEQCFFQLLSDEFSQSLKSSNTIITTNKPFAKWGELFGDLTIANAILDRLLHHSHIININGNSYRLKDKFLQDDDNKS